MAANSGTKYVSVNLNKSYGQHSTALGSVRSQRPGAAVVPSRPRSSHKAGPKLSVPPPLNLPSLRKEHERFDSLGSGGGPAGPGGSGSGSRPSSAGLGWTKPVTEDVSQPVIQGKPSVTAAAPVSSAVLRGEDFPSLRATLAPVPSPNQKIQENLNSIPNPKQKHSLGDENVFVEEKKEGPLVTDQSSVSRSVNVVGAGDDGRGSRVVHTKYGLGRKQEEYFPGPLPLVRLNPRSDWADDERDTGHGLTREGRDHGFPKGEAYWDFDIPRVGVLPHKHDKRGPRSEVGKVLNSEIEAFDRMGSEGNSWRSSNLSIPKDAGNERNGVSVGPRPSSGSRDGAKDGNKYVPSPFRDDDIGKRDFGRRDGQGGKQKPWNNVMEPYGDRNREQLNRSRGDSVQSSVSRSAFSSGGKGLPVNDPLLNFGREKRALPKSEKNLLEDQFMKDFGGSGFDGRDLFSGGLVGVVKKKKDMLKQTDFHDPVRESFEAELERVQRMQEQERQRIIEEQERAMELARREEEERLRQAREQEERQRRLEEEAREAAWRAEQERMEAVRKAEEQRLAREEEKRRILLEEERRKQAAKQKLLELEQKIARRQAEAAKSGSNAPVVVEEKMPAIVNEKETSRATDVGDWEDSERMVDRILTSASSDSSSVNRPLEMGSRSHFARDLSSTFVDRGKPVNSWRRDTYENWNSSAFYSQDQENSHNSPRRDLSIGGKAFMRKEYNGGPGLVSSRTYYKGAISEPHLDEYAHVKPQRWNQSADGDHLSRNTEVDSDFHENYFEKFGDGWTQGRSRGNPFPSFPERTYPNSESDGPYGLGRSRYSVRQPRVLPPPSLGSVHRTYKNEDEHPGPSAFLENEMHYNQATRSDSTLPTGYDNGNRGQREVVDSRPETAENEDHKVETTPRCDSQSSLSVSSPPSSPTHLSHDDLDDSGDSHTILTSEDIKSDPLTAPDNESITTPAGAGNENVVAPCAVSSGEDDEWTTENNEHFQEQEEYEDEDYQEEDEVHEGDDHAQLNQDFDDMHLQEKGLPHLMDNLVLGFDEGVQVGMPNEEFERTSKDEETTFMAQASGLTLEDRISYDEDDTNLQPVNDASQVNLNSTSSVFQESEKPAQDLVIQPSDSLSPVVSDSLGNVEASNGLLTHHSTPSSVTIAPYYSSSGQAVTSNVAAAPSQAEVPIKLQFGLFSGPSLIPSPVPAIQIGSIQMPLHLHPQVGTPLSHIHPSQPPLFQFGQLRYTSPISQGIMPLGPQSMSFVQPNIPSSFSYNQQPGSQMAVQTGPETSDSFVKNEMRHHSVDSQPGNSRNLPQGSAPSEDAGNITGIKQGRIEAAHDPNNSTRTSTSFQSDKQENQNAVGRNTNIPSNSKGSEVHAVIRDSPHYSVSKENFTESRTQYPASGGRGKRYIFTVKNSNSRPSGPSARVNRPEPGGFLRRPRRNIQRTEFRVRESSDKRQSTSAVLTDQFGFENKSNTNGRGAGLPGRPGPRKAMNNKLGKQIVESATENSQVMDSGSRVEKVDGKESIKTQNFSHPGNLKRTLCSEEDVDAPLQSGVIRVFEQPGIEAPSDEDDFIEVRSKRQMLNDRREQREKEIKAKSRVAKVQRRPRSSSQSVVAVTNSTKGSISPVEVVNSIHAAFVAAEVRGMKKMDASSGFNSSMLSQALPPIGTPPLKIDSQTELRSQISSRSLQTSVPAVSGSGEKDPGSGVIFESKNKVLDNVQTSLGSWSNAQISQQVMALTQTQLDEAMKPQQFDSQASVANIKKGAVNEASLPSSSILTKEKTFSSAANPINSLLAGEKIQFGAVTSPTILPSSSRVVSHGIGPPRSSRSDMQMTHNLTGSDNDCSLFFDKEKHGNKSHGHLDDCDAEAEAEAAASAVAVAAISSDEIVGNGLGNCSVPAPDGKSFVAADIDRVVAGVGVEKQSASQSRSEEPLSVSLPADLSVETPPISLWPPLPTTRNSSGQMISHFPSVPPHFPSGPPSHFPFYEMNPMMGGPVFAFGPHDESASTTQSQPQNSTTSASRPIGSWQQCHSGVESFYGPPTGFTGPFIAPPGGIPGVQGPPHMVVYNHFAPVGQFGQVGLSFMGTTYIPSGKQPDWKHVPTSATGAGEGDMNSMNMASSQRNPANIPSPIQHLAPGSPLMPMASPVAMFDVSPFQPSTEMSVQARWPHGPNSQLPLSMPLQQLEGVQTSQFSHGPSVDQPLNAKRFTGSRASTSSDGDRSFPRTSDVNVNQLPDELGLVDTSNTTANKTAQSVVNKTPSVIPITEAVKVDVQNGSGNNSNNQNASSSFKSQSSQQVNISAQQSDHSSGHTNYQRGGVSQRNNSGGEWSHRRGYQGRNQSLGSDKNFSSTKVKQIYVAKQTISGASTVS